ncbi:MAG: hypothetical protein ABIG39_07705 [Candidatus Micrarchaeota archaeon]
MFDDKEAMKFSVLACLAILMLMWALDMFSLKTYPIALPLLFTIFFLNPLLIHFGERIFGEDARDDAMKIVAGCTLLAFIILWVSNPGQNITGHMAIPAALMFLLPSILYAIRATILGSERNVRSQ